MRLNEITDYREIYSSETLAHLLGLALMNPTPGKVRNAAQGAYAKQQGHFFAAEDDGAIIGIIGYRTIDNNQIHLLHVAVDEARRGKGIGRWMVETVRSFLKEGIVTAEVNPGQEGFWEAVGFTCIRETDSEEDDGQVQCIWRV